MKTITEDYVSFEVAKLLKEKGFAETCYACYEYFSSSVTMYSGWSFEYKGEVVHNSDNTVIAPTLQMAMKWLREVHYYIIEIHYGNVGSPIEPEIQWWWELENKQGEFLEGNITDGNTTYEQACEAAIKYCLENLIE